MLPSQKYQHSPGRDLDGAGEKIASVWCAGPTQEATAPMSEPESNTNDDATQERFDPTFYPCYRCGALVHLDDPNRIAVWEKRNPEEFTPVRVMCGECVPNPRDFSS
jgi:hypothetical protein